MPLWHAEGADTFEEPLLRADYYIAVSYTHLEMIEKYYAAHIKTNLDAAAINIMRPKSKKTQKSAKRSDAARQNSEA